MIKKVKAKSLSRVHLLVNPGTAAHQAPPSMGFSRQEYWSGMPFPSPGDVPNPGIESRSPTLQADALPSEQPGKPDGKEPPFNAEDPGLIPGLGRSPGEGNGILGNDIPLQYSPLEDLLEEMATHSSFFAWRIPWTGQPGGSMLSQRVGHD